MAKNNPVEEFEIIVDDGTKEVPIKNTRGERIGTFYFRPTDIGILQRYKEVSEKFDAVVQPLADININPDGTSDDELGVTALKMATSKLYELCDYLFGGNLSEAFFGTMSPFSPVNGKFYCEVVLNQVADYVGKQFQTETQKINARVSKYTAGYKK